MKKNHPPGTISAYQLAKEIGVTVQAVYKKVNKEPALSRLRIGGGWYFDAAGAAAVRAAFGVVQPCVTTETEVVQPYVTTETEVVQPCVTTETEVVQPYVTTETEVVQPMELVIQLKDEIQYLRHLLDDANARNSELVVQLTELSRNNQVLIGMTARRPLLERIFRRRKDEPPGPAV
jgi:hypothetical protein